MAVAERHINLARTLPLRLQRFFALNPPQVLNSSDRPKPPSNASDGTEENHLPTDHDRQQKLNPFQPHKDPRSGRWHPPIYSLRRQAELVKLAREHDVEDLLPYTVKKTEERRRRMEERGLRVKGTGEGQHVKGHLWERTMKGRLEKRRQAMLDMPRMIQEWRQRAHGRRWKKWPK